MAHPKIVEQSKIAIEPASTPPLPAEARTFLSPHEMSAYLLLQPVLNETEAASGIANCKVVHPAADDRVDQLDCSPYRLRIEALEDVFELTQQYRALLELGRIVRPPFTLQAAYTAELKAQKSKAFAFCQVNVSALLFVNIDLESGQFHSQSPVHRLGQPARSGICIHQNHQVVSEPRVLKISVRPAAGYFLGSLQHPVDLIEVQVAEQGREHSALGQTLLACCLGHQSLQMHDLGVVDPSRNFLEQDVMPDVVEKRAQIIVENPGLVLNDCLRNSFHRLVRRPLGPVAVRPRLEIGLEDRLKDKFERALRHAVPDGGDGGFILSLLQ
jgi:hypothetical protein